MIFFLNSKVLGETIWTNDILIALCYSLPNTTINSGNNATTGKLWKLVRRRHTGLGPQLWRKNTVEKCLMQPTECNPAPCFPIPNPAPDGSLHRIILPLDQWESYLSHKQRLAQLQWRWIVAKIGILLSLRATYFTVPLRGIGAEKWHQQERPATTNSLARKPLCPIDLRLSSSHWHIGDYRHQ